MRAALVPPCPGDPYQPTFDVPPEIMHGKDKANGIVETDFKLTLVHNLSLSNFGTITPQE